MYAHTYIRLYAVCTFLFTDMGCRPLFQFRRPPLFRRGFFACFRAPLIETLQMYGSHLVLGWSKSGSLEPIPNPNPNPKPNPKLKPKRKERKIDVRAVNNFNGYRSVISIAMYMDLSEF